MKKVLHVIDSFGAGGAETWLLQVARHLQSHPETGLHIDFLATGGVTAIYDDAVLQTGAKIFYIKYSLKNFISFRSAFKRLLAAEQYDAIHDHQDFISGWHFLCGWGSLPAIRVAHLHNPYNFVHNYVVNPGRWFSFKFGRLLTLLFTSKITGTSNSVMDEYGYNKWPFSSKRVAPVYCGFEVSKFQYNKNAKAAICEALGWDAGSTKIALFTGRIGLQSFDTARNQKNPEFAFEVARGLVEQNENWRFLFVGFKGMLGEKLEATAKEAGLSDKIKFLGVRNDVPALMSAADVLVFPSLWEGLGMVAVEAQAAGLPVVMSGSVPKEAIVINELILLKKLEEGPAVWANGCREVVAKAKERKAYAKEIAASPFSIEQSIANLMKLYTGAEWL